MSGDTLSAKSIFGSVLKATIKRAESEIKALGFANISSWKKIELECNGQFAGPVLGQDILGLSKSCSDEIKGTLECGEFVFKKDDFNKKVREAEKYALIAKLSDSILKTRNPIKLFCFANSLFVLKSEVGLKQEWPGHIDIARRHMSRISKGPRQRKSSKDLIPILVAQFPLKIAEKSTTYSKRIVDEISSLDGVTLQDDGQSWDLFIETGKDKKTKLSYDDGESIESIMVSTFQKNLRKFLKTNH